MQTHPWLPKVFIFGHACSGEMRELCQRVLEAPGAAPPWKKLLNEVDDPSFLGRHRQPHSLSTVPM